MKNISFRVSEEQRSRLHKDAEENGLTVSEYIKIRLFDEKSDRQETNDILLSNYEKNLVSIAVKNYYVSQLLAKKISTEEEISNAINKANQVLQENGYLKQSGNE
ncbi:MAG: hypothetical protein HON23_05355 [Rickettsiales bacterium]|jgi:hypothetical protein|nr:hypothetical protein [Rickettsiales bacterium]